LLNLDILQTTVIKTGIRHLPSDLFTCQSSLLLPLYRSFP